MSVNHSARSVGIIILLLIIFLLLLFLFSLTRRYVVCSHLNRLIEGILISTHNIPFFQYKRENHPNLS